MSYDYLWRSARADQSRDVRDGGWTVLRCYGAPSIAALPPPFPHKPTQEVPNDRRQDRADSRTMDDAAELGALGRSLPVRGYEVLTPARPGMDGDIEQLRADPTAIEHLGIQEIVDHYDEIIRGLDSRPIIMGHSFGGAFTEILLDRGLGAAGVAIDAAAVTGITKLPFSTLKSGSPSSRTPPTSMER